MMATKNLAALFVCLMALSVPTMVQAWTVGSVPADGVYKFTFGGQLVVVVEPTASGLATLIVKGGGLESTLDFAVE